VTVAFLVLLSDDFEKSLRGVFGAFSVIFSSRDFFVFDHVWKMNLRAGRKI
jgi:hypothetical protein